VIWHPQLASLLARFRHANAIAVLDAPFPTYPDVETVDLIVRRGLPTIPDLVDLILAEHEVSSVVMAEEFRQHVDAPTQADYLSHLGDLPVDSVAAQLYAEAAGGQPSAVLTMQPVGPVPGAINGVMFRAQVQPNKVTGYQAEVDGDPVRLWSGGLYDEGRRMWFASPIKGDAASEKAFRDRAGSSFKRDGWNTYRITCQGKRLKIEVNGVTTTDIEDGMDAKGYIGLQHHGEAGQTYKFRNPRIREL
jgi:D-ribose pyranose/furanose isomerase RbsD